LEEVPLLQEYCKEKDIKLIAHSLLCFEKRSNPHTPSHEVLFFSSIRAAEFYLLDHTIGKEVQIAAIGEKTAEKLRKLGLEVHFVGSAAGDPPFVAQEFKTWLAGRKVLVPCSDRSNRSIASSLPKEQVDEILVYRTVLSPIKVENVDLYIFSSPSNIQAFLEMNQFPIDAKIIVWGKTSESYLNKLGLKAYHVLLTSTEEELIQFLAAKK
jgi:uroporphyrinogen-III synthase